MSIKRIIFLAACISILPVHGVYATTKEVENTHVEANSGFKFSPIAHANTAELLAFITYYQNLEKEQQKAAYLEVVQALATDKTDIKLRVKHAVILLLPGSALRDTKTAEQHLKALLADNSITESNANLVKLLQILATEHHVAQQTIHDVTKKTNMLKKKNKALGRKLNDLKNIEKTMIERNAKTN